jgi:uncharacterized protein YndB with AHSA1/START domain
MTPNLTPQSATVELIGDRELTMTRWFAAPPELVYDACTKAEHVRRWYGLRGAPPLEECSIDLRTGGRWRYNMGEQDGMVMAFSGEFLELDPPRRTVNTEEFEPMPGTGYIVTTTYEPENGGCRLTAHLVFQQPEHRDGLLASGMEWGAQQSYDRLDELVASLHQGELVLARIFDAPPQQVFDAWTRPEAFVQWFAPDDMTTEVGRFDLEVGGGIVYRMYGDGYDSWSWSRRVAGDPPHRLEFMDGFADENGNRVPPSHYGLPAEWKTESRLLITFDPHPRGTLLTLRHDVQDEDSMTGWNSVLDQLGAYLAPQAAATPS